MSELRSLCCVSPDPLQPSHLQGTYQNLVGAGMTGILCGMLQLTECGLSAVLLCSEEQEGHLLLCISAVHLQ